MTSIRLPVLLAIVALSVGVRLGPYVFGAHHADPGSMAYPWNFSPILALSLFGGALYASRRLVYLVPLATYLLGDIGIWLVTGRADWALYAGQPVVYLAVALVATCGFLLRGKRSWGRLAGSGLVAAVGFFIVTNFAVWASGGGPPLSDEPGRAHRLLRAGHPLLPQQPHQHGGLPAAAVQPGGSPRTGR